MDFDNKNKEEFIEGLKLVIKQGYSNEIVAKYAFDFYLSHKIIDKKLYELVEDIMVIDAGPEFELTKKELIKLVEDKLK